MPNSGALHERMERFVNADLPRAESRDLVCLLLGRERPAMAGEAPAEDDYDLAFSGAASRLAQAAADLEADRREAELLWKALAVQPRERRVVRVRNEARFATWGLHALLLDRSRSRASAGQDPAAATHLAELALEIAERLDPRRYGAERVADFRAAALIALGTARRLEGDRAGAERAAREAREALAQGTGDRLEKAELLRLQAALHLDAGKAEDAAGPLARARSLERLLGREGAEPTPEIAEILGPLCHDRFAGQEREDVEDEPAAAKRRA